ncbi:MAG: Holliday junction resolvase-like protein [Candidatus Diapherotrites archaeon]
MIEIILGGIILILAIGAFLLWKRVQELGEYVNTLSFSKQSQSVKYGKMSEQWIPLSEKFPYEKERFRFIGNPVDGIAFLDDKIVFCEFKSNTSRLTEKQEEIKRLVKEKKIEWFELRT